MTDKQLKEQFTNLFGANIGIILKISRAYTKTIHDREDLINDIALEMWKAFPRFKGESKLSTWVYRIALNTSLNYKRKRKNKTVPFSDISQTEGFSRLIESETDNQATEILYACIDELNEINKAIIILYLDGNPYDDIAEITGISNTNVGTRLMRIKEELKKMAIKKS
jgi:RNA polymerase sigma-70 factor, ECF subfamily